MAFMTRLDRNSKIPPKGTSWKQGITDDPFEHERWIAEGYNIGFPLEENGCSAIDFDVKEAARDFWRKYPGLCTMAVVTRRGLHVIFSGKTRTRKFQYGDIKGNGYLTAPPSIVDGWQYRWIVQKELQPFPEHLFPEEESIRPITRNVRSALRYVMQVESIERGNGSNKAESSNGLVRAAAICRDGGLSELEAMSALVRWNQTDKVSPAWQPEELARAIQNTYRKG